MSRLWRSRLALGSLVVVAVVTLGGVLVARQQAQPARPPAPAPGVDCFRPGATGPSVPLGARQVQLVGQLGGRPGAFAIRGDRAYLTLGARLLVIDIADPARPQLAGGSPPLGEGLVDGVTLVDQYAYVAVRGLCIVDLADPGGPRAAAFVDLPDGVADAAVQDGYAYVGSGGNLLIFDVSDPLRPVEVARLAPHWDRAATVSGVALAGHYVYLLDDLRNLAIVDVADPRHPQERGQLAGNYRPPGAEAGYARGILAAGTTVYRAIPGAALSVVDASNPDHPVENARLALDHPGSAIALSGKYVYLGGYESLFVVDVSSPSQPALVATLKLPGRQDVSAVATAGTTVYLSSFEGGVLAIDVSDPQHPRESGSLDLPGGAMHVAASDHYAYVADARGLHVVDVADPARPQPVGMYAPGPPRGQPAPPYAVRFPIGAMYASGSLVYALAQPGGLQVVDVADPAHPVLAGQVSLRERGEELIAADGYLYVSAPTTPAELHIIDIREQRQPREVGSYQQPGHVAVAGRFAYLASGGDITIVDLSDPAHPAAAGHYALGRLIDSAVTARGYLYVSDEDTGLHVLSLADGVNLVEVAHEHNIGWKARATDRVLYLTGGASASMLNIADPAHLFPAGEIVSYALWGVGDVAVVEPYVYLPSSFGGLNVLYFDAATAAPLPTVTPFPSPTSPPRPTRPPGTPTP